MGKRGNWYTILLVIILVASLVMIILQNIPAITGNAPLTGHLTQGSTYSNVTISYYLAILMSPNLTQGIDFGTIINLTTDYNNATGNYNATNMTQYNITVSPDSNTAVDFCIKANAGLTTFPSGLSTIGLGNETYASNNTLNSALNNNLTVPAMSFKTNMTTGYIKAVNATPVGNTSQWRFWLYAPAAQAAGNYNNTVSFEGVQATLNC